MLQLVGNDLFLPRGDTGKLLININSIHATTADDRVLFTVKHSQRPIIIRVMTPVANAAVLEFTNEMTKNLAVADYKYDIRFIRDAVLDGDGVPIGGEGVDTPRRIGTLHLLETAGEV